MFCISYIWLMPFHVERAGKLRGASPPYHDMPYTLEEAPPDRRAALLPKHKVVLTLLEDEARREGRDAVADLFMMAREAS